MPTRSNLFSTWSIVRTIRASDSPVEGLPLPEGRTFTRVSAAQVVFNQDLLSLSHRHFTQINPGGINGNLL
jgi:hypothetical protein